MINTKIIARNGLFHVLNKLLQFNGRIVAGVHPGFLEVVVHGVRAELLEVLQGVDLVPDASNNNLVHTLQVHVVEVDQPCLFHPSGDHAHNPIGFVLVDVDPRTALGHHSSML